MTGHRKRPRDPNQLAKLIAVHPAAMAAGVTDKLWDVSDIVAMLEKWEAAN